MAVGGVSSRRKAANKPVEATRDAAAASTQQMGDGKREGAIPVSTSAASSTEITAASFEEVKRLATIAEIVELMEDTKKNKDWLLDQIRQKRQRISIRPEMSVVGVLKMCSQEFLANLYGYLQSNEFDIGVDVPPITKNYHWFFTDIIAASDPDKTAMEQARKIIALNKLTEVTDVFKQRDPESTLVLPTGDGMAIGFDDTPENPLNLAIEIHKGLSRYNKTRKKEDMVELRIGLDSGPVYIIKDLNGNENVWGPGIIMARRVMDLADRMNILASAKFANEVKMLKPDYRNILHPIGNYQIKHGGELLIYNVYGEEFGNKKPPLKDKKQKSQAATEVQKTISRFLFNYIGIDLDVKETTNWLTHHTMTWQLVNISKEPVERLFYYLSGDRPRQFPDLNIVVRDEEDRELEIMSINVNKPDRKEFFVKFRRPLKPGEKGRLAVIEYDWEESDRKYYYRFASDCKKFDFHLKVPKGPDINQKVVKIEETGDMQYAKTPAIVKYLPDKTDISWSATNLNAYEHYRFDW